MLLASNMWVSVELVPDMAADGRWKIKKNADGTREKIRKQKCGWGRNADGENMRIEMHFFLHIK